MNQFARKSLNFIILITAAITLLFIDLYLFLGGKTTFSESIWEVNQVTLALSFGIGLVCGHCFTVPKDNPKS